MAGLNRFFRAFTSGWKPFSCLTSEGSWPFRFLAGATLLFLTVLFTGVSWSAPLFREVTEQAGLVDPGNERGLAWGDYDGDGDPDLFVVVINGQDRLYRNEGDRTFTDVTLAAGLADSTMSAAPAWCDYDGDGDLDLYVARPGPNSLYRNQGDGTFTEVAAETGVTGTGVSWGLAWGDADRDGWVDLYVVNFGQNPNRLYQNLGDGTFRETAATAGVADSGNGLSASWADFDSDGDLDLYLANKYGVNRFYLNDGRGVFADIADSTGAQDTNHSVGTTWGDGDNDGDLDLFMSSDRTVNRLFLNQGDLVFLPAGESAGLAHPGSGRGLGWADFDHDGNLDLYLANSDGDNILYRNEGNATFTDVTAGSGAEDGGTGTAAAWADYDGDGDLDLALSNFGDRMRLFENLNEARGHWLMVKLESPGPNTRAVGARVRVHAGGRNWIRENTTGGGYQSQSPHLVHFGLGQAAEVDSVVVRWPTGEISRHGPFEANQLLVLRLP
jgi:hypothetical protein